MNHYKNMSILGYGYMQQECVDVASQYAVQLGQRTADNPLSMKWIKGFLSRWPEMKVTKPRAFDYYEAKSAIELAVKTFFSPSLLLPFCTPV